MAQQQCESLSQQKRDGARVIGLDKRQLLNRHCTGDATAFPELVNTFREEVYSYLVRCGIAAADRDDLFQEIFFSVHRAAKKYDPKFALEPWLFTIVVNTVRNYFRKIKRTKEDSASDSPDQADSAPGGQQISEARETAQWLEREILTLPFEQREAVLLSYVKDMEQQDVATALKLPLSTIKTHLRRARMKLIERFNAREKIVSAEGLR